VTGDAAGFVVNLGFTVRGMDFAVESGRLAAEAVIAAKEAGDFSKEQLSSYVKALEDSFIMKDMKALKGFPTILSRREVFKDLPEMVDDICTKAFTVSGKPSMDFIMYVINSAASHLSVAQLTSLVGDIMDAF
jgi:electron transfer flavoprotein-quinone oxidoreductase